jgi:hypothetical protein
LATFSLRGRGGRGGPPPELLRLEDVVPRELGIRVVGPAHVGIGAAHRERVDGIELALEGLGGGGDAGVVELLNHPILEAVHHRPRRGEGEVVEQPGLALAADELGEPGDGLHLPGVG